MNCAEHKNEELANCPSCLAEYWKEQYWKQQAENARLRAALETIKLRSVSLADAQVTALEALKGQP